MFFKKITALITRENVEFSEVDKVVQENAMNYINGTIDDIMRIVCRNQNKTQFPKKVIQKLTCSGITAVFGAFNSLYVAR